jgi:glutamate-1-semialdehyde aminotransferase
MIQIHFGIEKIRNKRDAMNVDRATTNRFHLGLRANGVMASYHPLFISNAHTEQQMHLVLDASENVLRQMKD